MKPTRSRLAAAALLLAILVPLQASATGLSFTRQSDGSRSGFTVNVSGGTLTLTANHVCNPQAFGQGVYLTVFYRTSPNPAGSGYQGAQFYIGSLDPGTCFVGISRSGAHTSPPQGTYYVHLLATSGSSISSFDDALTASNTMTFTGGGGSTNDIFFDGAGQVNLAGDQVRMRGSICNLRSGGTSGTLRWRWRMTTQSVPYGNGYDTTEVVLNPLPAGQCYYNLDRTVPFNAPPPGTYHSHFTVVESPNNATILDSITFPDLYTRSANAGDSGGGGLPGDSVLLLSLAAVARRLQARRRPAPVP